MNFHNNLEGENSYVRSRIFNMNFLKNGEASYRIIKGTRKENSRVSFVDFYLNAHKNSLILRSQYYDRSNSPIASNKKQNTEE